MLWSIFVLALAWADEPEASEEDRVAELERELAALKERLDEMELLAEAESLAAESPPPAPPPSAPNVFNPSITAFGDAFATLGVEGGEVVPGSGPWLRSLELDVRADVDPYAKAVAVLAFEQEPPLEAEEAPADEHGPAFAAVPEEVYVELVALPAGFSARLGQFRQPFGVTNKAHPHDWPWPNIPAPLGAILGEEGWTDAGGMLTWRVPNPWDTGLTLEAGALRGQLLDEEETTAVPQWFGRAEWYHEAGAWDVALGGSATGLQSDVVGGADLVIRWRQSSWRSVLLLVEALADSDTTGAYAAVQVQPTRAWFLGVRGDLVDEQWQAGGYVTWYGSEFLRVRAGAMAGEGRVLADAQLTFVWGSHPVEPYWVNR